MTEQQELWDWLKAERRWLDQQKREARKGLRPGWNRAFRRRMGFTKLN